MLGIPSSEEGWRPGLLGAGIMSQALGEGAALWSWASPEGL